MSGQEGIRGYIYQTVICAISALSNNDWDRIHVEPKTKDDKADIIYYQGNNIVLCQQVKSSVNLFEPADIKKWLTELYRDLPNARKYEVSLIGNASASANKLIKKIRSDTANISCLIPGLPDGLVVDISIIPFAVEWLDSRMRDEVNKFISGMGYSVLHNSLALLSNAFSYNFFSFSLAQQPVTKRECTDSLIKWIELNYPDSIRSTTSDLRVYFYNQETSECISEIQSENVTINLSEEQTKYANEVERAFFDAVRIYLPPRQISSQNEQAEEKFKLVMNFEDLLDKVPSEISDSRKGYIKENLHAFFNKVVNDDFFSVGNLMKSPSTVFSTYFFGANDEKTKFQLLNNLYFDLKSFVELTIFLDHWHRFKTVPLILTNVGSQFDEEISVTIEIPESINFASAENIPVPDDISVLEYIIENEIITKHLKLVADGEVEGFPNLIPDFSDIDHNLETAYRVIPGSGFDMLNHKKSIFNRGVDQIFNFSVFKGRNGYNKLKFDFPQQNPNVLTAFPGLLLIEASSEIYINYSIKSKRTQIVKKGALLIK